MEDLHQLQEKNEVLVNMIFVRGYFFPYYVIRKRDCQCAIWDGKMVVSLRRLLAFTGILLYDLIKSDRLNRKNNRQEDQSGEKEILAAAGFGCSPRSAAVQHRGCRT